MRAGVFSGAGISDAPPASLPSGDVFHRRLRELCLARALPYAADLVDKTTLDAISASRLNLLARIDNTSPGCGAGALRCMSAPIPNETHLLAALHLVADGLHVTMNFDDSIERAYSLLSGDTDLPAEAQPRLHQALDAWREFWPSGAAPLRVVSRPQEIACTLSVRPLLLKLHGSLGRDVDGLTLSMPPMTDEPDPADIGAARSAAFDALASEGFVLVTGFSATDLASRSALLSRLTPGRFWWVAAEIDGDVRRRVAAIDASQPMIGQPVDVLRTMQQTAMPAWPRVRAPGPTFDRELDGWAAGLAPEVASEALAWALTDAGHVEVAVEILRRLVRDGAGARTQVRLADALARRRRPGDVRSARRTFIRAALSRPDECSGPARGHRSYALARWFESVGSGPDAAPAIAARPLAGAAAIAAVAVGSAGRAAAYPTAAVRTTTVACATVLTTLERDLPTILRTPMLQRPMQVSLVAVTWAARLVHDSWTEAPSGRRRAMLERQIIELETISALLRNAPPPVTALASLGRLSAVFHHVSDDDSRVATAGTRALVAIAAKDVREAGRAIDEARQLSPDCRGATALAQRLLTSAVDNAAPKGIGRAGLQVDDRRRSIPGAIDRGDAGS